MRSETSPRSQVGLSKLCPHSADLLGIAVIWTVRIWTVSGPNQTLFSVPPSTTPRVSSTTSKASGDVHWWVCRVKMPANKIDWIDWLIVFSVDTRCSVTTTATLGRRTSSCMGAVSRRPCGRLARRLTPLVWRRTLVTGYDEVWGHWNVQLGIFFGFMMSTCTFLDYCKDPGPDRTSFFIQQLQLPGTCISVTGSFLLWLPSFSV